MATTTYINRNNVTKLVHDSIKGFIIIYLSDGTTLEIKTITDSKALETINYIGYPHSENFLIRIDVFDTILD